MGVCRSCGRADAEASGEWKRTNKGISETEPWNPPAFRVVTEETIFRYLKDEDMKMEIHLFSKKLITTTRISW